LTAGALISHATAKTEHSQPIICGILKAIPENIKQLKIAGLDLSCLPTASKQAIMVSFPKSIKNLILENSQIKQESKPLTNGPSFWQASSLKDKEITPEQKIRLG